MGKIGGVLRKCSENAAKILLPGVREGRGAGKKAPRRPEDGPKTAPRRPKLAQDRPTFPAKPPGVVSLRLRHCKGGPR